MSGNYQVVKAWRKANPEKVAAQARRRLMRKREQIYANKRRWRAMNIESCRKQEAEYARTRRKSNPEGNRKRVMAFRERRRLKNEQIAGRPAPANCELCGEPSITKFDHCHASGNFRGWLCDRCNRTLGSVKDSIPLLLKMADYLRNGGIPNG